jgi:hypothetical protein
MKNLPPCAIVAISSGGETDMRLIAKTLVWRLGAIALVLGFATDGGAQGLRLSSADSRQSAQTGGLGDTGGIPENIIPGANVPLFNADEAQRLGDVFAQAKEAAAKCDRAAYDHAYSSFRYDAPMDGPGRYDKARAEADLNTIYRFKDGPDFPRFPPSCNPPPATKASHASAVSTMPAPFSVFIVGGGQFPVNGGGAVTGVDTFFGPGAFLIDNRQTGGSASVNTPFFGLRGRAAIGFEKTFLDGNASIEMQVPQVFIESGVQSGFGAQSFIQNFGGVSGVPQGFGSNRVNENLQVPLFVGLGIPTGPGPNPIFFDIYGGVVFDSWTHVLQGGEVGSPATRGIYGQNSRFSVDPAFGIGVRTRTGSIWGAPLIIGANLEVSFRPGDVVTSPSGAFPSETYFGTYNPTANVTGLLRVGIPFGAPPPPP